MLEIVNKLRTFTYKDQREELCRELDVKLKTFCSVLELCWRQGAITEEKFEVWCRQAKKVDDMAVYAAIGLQRRRERRGGAQHFTTEK